MTDKAFTEKKEFLKTEIDRIVAQVYNEEQKILAKSILDNATANNIDALYTFITQRVKLGFTFDAAPESNHNRVALVKKHPKLKSIGNGFDQHKMIIGENYDALKNLLVTHTKNGKGLIDVIYIDPPYNTESAKGDGNNHKDKVEAKKFIYRDKYTRNGWLNFMRERLVMARKLLSDNGVIYVSIDDNEQAYLKVLMDEIFGEDNFVANFIRNIPDGNNLGMISITHEYCLCYKKANLPALFVPFDSSDGEIATRLTKNGNTKSQITFPAGLLSVFTETKSFTGEVGGASERIKIIGEMNFENGKLVNDVILEAEWGMPDMIKRILIGDEVYDRKGQKLQLPYFTNTGIPYLKKDRTSGIFRSVQLWNNTRELNDIFQTTKNSVFPNPKPTTMLVDLFKLTTHYNKTAIILDFFAGSGSTGHAVMALNEEDGGQRKCILIANNENSIGEGIMYERISRVVNGKGSNGDETSWKYSPSKPYLSDNSWDIFDIEYHNLKIDETKKAQKLVDVCEKNFKALNSDYEAKNFDVYNQLASLTPQKTEEDDTN